MLRRHLASLALLPACALTACGATDTAPDRAAVVRAAMTRWAATTEPSEACTQISRGFALFLTKGHPAECSSRLGKALKLPGWDVSIRRVRFRDRQALVDAVPVGHPKDASTWYFVEVDGAWKLNSIGINVGAPPPGGLPDPPPR